MISLLKMGVGSRKVVVLSVVGVLLVGGAIVYLAVNGVPGSNRQPLDAAQTLCAEAKQKGGDKAANECFQEQALRRLKAQYCESILLTSTGDQTSRARCLRQVAYGLGDAKLCKLTGSDAETDLCLDLLARDFEDAELCLQSSTPAHTDGCLSRVASAMIDTAPCMRMAASYKRNDCVWRTVGQGADAKACAGIDDDEFRTKCLKIAAKLDPSVCSQLRGASRGECWAATESGFADVETACEGSAECLQVLARNDISACALIEDGQSFLRTTCFARPGHQSERIHDSVCEKLPRPELRDECLAGVALGRDHGESCSKIRDLKRRSDCAFAAGKLDPLYCRVLASPTEVRRCIAESNFRTADDSICAGLEERAQRDCRRGTASELTTLLHRGRR